jgi:hypothetical protein
MPGQTKKERINRATFDITVFEKAYNIDLKKWYGKDLYGDNKLSEAYLLEVRRLREAK